jgi:hypothetical protein
MLQAFSRRVVSAEREDFVRQSPLPVLGMNGVLLMHLSLYQMPGLFLPASWL